MIVHDPYWREREDSKQQEPASLWVDLDKRRTIPFGFQAPLPRPVKKPKKSKKRKG